MARWRRSTAPFPHPIRFRVSSALTVACTPTPPPAVDLRDASIQALKDADAAWTKAVGEKDLEKWMSFYAADASVFAPGAPVATGKDAIRALLGPILKDQNFALSFAPTRVEADKAGELGYSQGAYRQTLTDPKTGKPFTEDGKFVTVYRKQTDGSWKAVIDIWNPGPPLSTPGKEDLRRISLAVSPAQH